MLTPTYAIAVILRFLICFWNSFFFWNEVSWNWRDNKTAKCTILTHLFTTTFSTTANNQNPFFWKLFLRKKLHSADKTIKRPSTFAKRFVYKKNEGFNKNQALQKVCLPKVCRKMVYENDTKSYKVWAPPKVENAKSFEYAWEWLLKRFKEISRADVTRKRPFRL